MLWIILAVVVIVIVAALIWASLQGSDEQDTPAYQSINTDRNYQSPPPSSGVREPRRPSPVSGGPGNSYGPRSDDDGILDPSNPLSPISPLNPLNQALYNGDTGSNDASPSNDDCAPSPTPDPAPSYSCDTPSSSDSGSSSSSSDYGSSSSSSSSDYGSSSSSSSDSGSSFSSSDSGSSSSF